MGTTTSTEYRPNPAPATGTASRELVRFTLAGRDFVLRRTIVQPGGHSGWHYHDGTLFVLVTGGDLDHPWTDCVPLTHRRGRIFKEPGGPENAHLARNLGTRPLTLTVLYVNPAGSPLSRSIPPPPCAR
ncbi:cupin domain-containing protein [Nocardia sp. CC227C]|uniref:cupin domain-containing protein n=1 Tax=Nocardia sp. CC227C TaxID=3044562 RepID=UPI00278BC68A|nr:hypothetical protein [Nocardia sp. CC227C]